MKKFWTKVAKSFRGKEKGFTLIELLIVIVILGVLAAAIIPNLSKFVGAGDKAAANAELASVKTGVAAYESESHGAIVAGTLPTAATVAGPVTGVVPGIVVNTVLTDPVNGYVAGTIKGVYQVDASGAVTRAANGAWPLTIIFALDNGNLHWIKGTAADNTTLNPP